MNLRKDHYRAKKKRLSLSSLREPPSGRPTCFTVGFYRKTSEAGRRLTSRTRPPLSARVREALGSSSNILRALARTPSRLTHHTTNGILSASTPMPRVTVVFPSTVVMAGSKFPPSLLLGGAEVEQT